MRQATEIPANFFAPDREVCLRAVSKALLKVRALDGVTREKLAKKLECSKDAISAASNEENMLSFDSIALLCHYFPDESAPIVAVLTGSVIRPLSAPEHLERAEQHIAAARRAAA